MNRTAITWLLFAAMAATVPTPYFMFVIAGLLPLSAVLYSSFRGPWGFALFNAVHVLIWGAILFLVARFGARRFPQPITAGSAALLVALLLAIGAIAFLPVYGVGHNEYEPLNLMQAFRRYL